MKRRMWIVVSVLALLLIGSCAFLWWDNKTTPLAEAPKASNPTRLLSDEDARRLSGMFSADLATREEAWLPGLAPARNIALAQAEVKSQLTDVPDRRAYSWYVPSKKILVTGDEVPPSPGAGRSDGKIDAMQVEASLANIVWLR